MPAARSSRPLVDFSESEKESEYETEGEEYEGSPAHRSDEEAEQDYAEEDDRRELGEEEETYAESEEEAEVKLFLEQNSALTCLTSVFNRMHIFKAWICCLFPF